MYLYNYGNKDSNTKVVVEEEARRRRRRRKNWDCCT
jgi:hypothetical protein